ncbi:type II toxin-antitoxin system Phd/YefM family antitoxin [Collinsella stercoris]|uniref:type II toxin-antitoxin system Phd/YefM family antitoxin n=1 Tax=Collinsella stercoris TaxID=147206 RepID=UPI00248E0C2C|nr:hypothetical protein [Collinsella stercoris]
MAHVAQGGMEQAGRGQVVADAGPEGWEIFEDVEDWELSDDAAEPVGWSEGCGAAVSSSGAFTEDPAGFLGQAIMGAAERDAGAMERAHAFPLGKWLRDDGGVPMREAKTHLSRLATYANDTGETIRVMRNGAPWFEIRPLAFVGHRV